MVLFSFIWVPLAIAGRRKKPQRAKKQNSNLCNAAVCLSWQLLISSGWPLTSHRDCRTESKLNNSTNNSNNNDNSGYNFTLRLIISILVLGRQILLGFCSEIKLGAKSESLAVFSGAINCDRTADEKKTSKSFKSCFLRVKLATKCQLEIWRQRTRGGWVADHQWVSGSVCKAPRVRGRQIAGSQSGSTRKKKQKNKSLALGSGNKISPVRNINLLTFRRH